MLPRNFSNRALPPPLLLLAEQPFIRNGISARKQGPVRFECSEQASSKDHWPTVLTWYCSKTQRHLSCFCSPALSQFWRNLSETMSMRRQKTVRMAQSDETIYSRWMNTNLQKLVNKYALLHVCPRPQLLGSVLDDKRTVTILFTLFAKRSEYMINYGCAKCQS